VIVVDASAVLEVLLGKEDGHRALDRMFQPGESRHAPHLLDLEVAQVLRRYAASGELSATRGAEAIEELAILGIERHGHLSLLPRIWELRRNMTAYDAAYVALAEALEATLVTRDEKLARTPGHRARVELI